MHSLAAASGTLVSAALRMPPSLTPPCGCTCPQTNRTKLSLTVAQVVAQVLIRLAVSKPLAASVQTVKEPCPAISKRLAVSAADVCTPCRSITQRRIASTTPLSMSCTRSTWHPTWCASVTSVSTSGLGSSQRDLTRARLPSGCGGMQASLRKGLNT